MWHTNMFLLQLPWPWPDDLGTLTGPKFYKDVSTYEINFQSAVFQKSDPKQDTQIDRHSDKRATTKHLWAVKSNNLLLYYIWCIKW